VNPPSGTVTSLFSEVEIAARVEQIARDVSSQNGADILIVAVLKGSFVFTADLIRALHRAGVRPQIDFMQLSSYGTGTESTGRFKVVRDVTDPVEGRDVLIVDDILDSGRTLSFARQRLEESGARRVQLCVLLDKQARRVAEVNADFVGFECPDEFVVGYGLDHANFYRELPFIGILQDPEAA
jgi:hypoxanthine phosphoribosyltransferase